MVDVTLDKDKAVFDIKGFHKFWSFQNKIIVTKANIIQASQSKDEFTFWKG